MSENIKANRRALTQYGHKNNRHIALEIPKSKFIFANLLPNQDFDLAIPVISLKAIMHTMTF